MTIMQFVRKYGVPLNIVHTASFKTPARQEAFDSRNLPEKELFEATEDEILKSIKFYQKRLNIKQKQLKKLHGVWYGWEDNNEAKQG